MDSGEIGGPLAATGRARHGGFASVPGLFFRYYRAVSDPHNLERFVDAQRESYTGVVAELSRGQKTGHWIWFIFPQIRGLGLSRMSRRYAIASIEEARAYAAHPLLGPRLIECVQLVMAAEGRSAEQVLGHIDAIKLRSCLTLFAAACADNDLYTQAIKQLFDGKQDPLTLEALA